jgi:hypothetical protein
MSLQDLARMPAAQQRLMACLGLPAELHEPCQAEAELLA